MITKEKIVFDIDYAEKYGIKGIQKQLVDMLHDIDYLLKYHRIDYTISYGTQLGAIRHGGFIPWDDDIDIIMKRSDFNRFKDILMNNEKYYLTYSLWVERIALKNDNRQVFIDISILDNYPQNKFINTIKAVLCRFFQGTMKEELDYSNYGLKHRLLLRFTGGFGRIVGKKWCLKMYHKAQQIGNNKHSDFYAAYNESYACVKIPYNKEWFNEYFDIEFEGIKVRSNIMYHELLQCYYGDYMALPPEEKRIPEHSGKTIKI